MNKYSSKAIKTAATVGMSLAMVLSAAAPVMAAPVTPFAPTGLICDTTQTNCAAVYTTLVDAIGDKAIAELSMDYSDEVTLDGTKYNLVRAMVFYSNGLKTYRLTNGSQSDKNVIKSWTDLTDPIVKMLGTDIVGDTDFVAGTEFTLASITDAAATVSDTTKGLLAAYNTASKASGTWVDATGKLVTTPALKKEAIDAYKQLEKWAASDSYNVLSTDIKNVFDIVYKQVEDLVYDALIPDDEVTANFVDEWSKVLDFDLDQKLATLATNVAITGKASFSQINLSNKSQLQGRIKAIKDAPDYEQVKNADSVTAIIDSYQELIDNLSDTKDLLKADSYVAYGKTKTADAEKTVKKALTTSVTEDGETLYTAIGLDTITTAQATDDAKYVAKHLDSEQWEILSGVKEDVLNVAYDFATKKVGNYFLDKGEFNSGITTTQINTLKRDLPGFLFKVVDNEKGTFGIDYVAIHMEDLNKALAAVTTDIEKLTPANIKSTDKATLEAAEDAYYELTSVKGKYVNNLTDKQAKDMRRVNTKINNLREAFDNLGTTAVAGWYDMGNGNWGYNNEDGTPAAYKWVASGSNWYMIKDGKMLRNTWLATDGGRWYYLDNAGKMVSNQSIDGCWINSYGVYMSPSYNG